MKFRSGAAAFFAVATIVCVAASNEESGGRVPFATHDDDHHHQGHGHDHHGHDHHDHKHQDHGDDDHEHGSNCGCGHDHGEDDGEKTVNERVQGFVKLAQHDVEEAVPWVLLGVAVTLAMKSVKLPIGDYLSDVRGGSALVSRLLTCAKAAAVGLATPLCSCGAIPIAVGLHAAGASLPAVVAFLTASQGAGLDSAMITLGLLGTAAAALRLFGAAFLAVAAGLAAPDPSRAKQGAGENGSTSERDVAAKKKEKEKAKEEEHGRFRITEAISSLVLDAGENLLDIGPSILLGVIFTSAFTTFGPSLSGMAASASSASASVSVTVADDAADWGDGDDDDEAVAAAASAAVSFLPFISSLGARALLLTAALPLQLCEHATVSLAAGIQRKGGSAGLAFAFLLSAPATNLASLIMLIRSAAGGGEGDDEDEGSKRPSAATAATSVAGISAALVAAALALSVAIDASGLEVGLIAKEEGHGHGGHHGHGPSEGVLGELWEGYEVAAPYIAAGLLAVALGKRVFPASASAKVKRE